MSRRARSSFLALLFCFGLHISPNGSIFASAHSTVPLHTVGESLLVAPLSVNGQGPFDFLIDTGTNTTLIDPSLASRLALKPDGAETLKTLTGPMRVARYVLTTLAAGTASKRDVPALAQPMTAVHRLDPEIQGVLGLNFLRSFSFRLDYAHRHLELYDARELPDVSAGAHVPARIIDDRLLVAVTSPLAPRGSWNLALDSGVSQLLIFADRIASLPTVCVSVATSDFASCAGQEPSKPGVKEEAPSARLATNLSERFTRRVTLETIGIGDLDIERLPAVVLSPSGSTETPAEDGLLPSCLFRSVLFDRTHSILVIDPN